MAALIPDKGQAELPVDRRIAGLARRQYGVVAYGQLRALGLTPKAIAYRARAGRLHRMHRGVFAVGHDVLDARARQLAAVFACGSDALLSHRSAAALWGLLAGAPRRLDVTVPGASRTGPAGLRVHRARRLNPEDRAEREGIPVTSLPRTLLDLAAILPRRRLDTALETAERMRVLDVAAVLALLDRAGGHRGRRRLAAALAGYDPAGEATRSELERRFLDLCRGAGLPAPAVNVAVAGHEVDAAWPDARLVVELDGFEHHGTRAAFERDRARDAELKLAGFEVLRLTHRRLAREPSAVARALRDLLAATPAERRTGAGAGRRRSPARAAPARARR